MFKIKLNIITINKLLNKNIINKIKINLIKIYIKTKPYNTNMIKLKNKKLI